MAVNAQQAIKRMASTIEFRTHGNLSGHEGYQGEYVIYSYDTPIARVSRRGQVWITTRWYSMTTAKHLSYVRQAFDKDVLVHSDTLETAKQTTKWRDLEGTLPMREID